jgi:ABC-2 type transport system ATP-binding protein
MSVLGSPPRQDPAFLAEVGYLAQEIPLYRRFTAEEHISIGAHLNRRWDAALVRDRLKSLKIPLDRAAGSLSGGQRAQLALTLTLAKKPRLVLLDEPVAALDPLARRHFLATMADAVAGDGLTVVLSSHLVADMERVVDHLILLAASRVQLSGDIDVLLAEHRVLVRPTRQDTAAIARTHTIVQAVHTPGRPRCSSAATPPVIDLAWGKPGVGLRRDGAGPWAGTPPRDITPDLSWRGTMTWLTWRQPGPSSPWAPPCWPRSACCWCSPACSSSRSTTPSSQNARRPPVTARTA